MVKLIWQLIFNPISTLKFLYSFSAQLALILLRRVLLPHHPTYQSLRIQAQRAYLSSAMVNFPALTHRLPVHATETQARKIGDKFTAYIIPGTERLEAYTGSDNCAVVLYAHGGGYAWGEARMYMKYMLRWKRVAGKRGLRLVFVSVEYPLSTTSPHPAQLNSFLSAYRHLLSMQIPASRIIFMGDSAGGGLSVLTGIHLLSSDLPQPAASVLVSPWMDMQTTTFDGGNPVVETDYVVSANNVVPMLCGMFVGNEPLDSPEVNPLVRKPEELRGLNRQLILLGAAEICLHDCREWAKLCKSAGVTHRLVTEYGQMHIYAMGSDWVDPAVVRRTDGFILDWIEDALGAKGMEESAVVV